MRLYLNSKSVAHLKSSGIAHATKRELDEKSEEFAEEGAKVQPTVKT